MKYTIVVNRIACRENIVCAIVGVVVVVGVGVFRSVLQVGTNCI